jgi:hypothetical protein
MSTSTWNPRFHRSPGVVAAGARRQVTALQALARWGAAFFMRPAYHHMGAFDLARSRLAREVLAARQRRLPRG